MVAMSDQIETGIGRNSCDITRTDVAAQTAARPTLAQVPMHSQKGPAVLTGEHAAIVTFSGPAVQYSGGSGQQQTPHILLNILTNNCGDESCFEN